MHKLGFSFRQFSKGVYFDGHNREDVIEDRKSYCDLMDKLGPRLLRNGKSTPISSERAIIRIFHDESTFYSNADQSFHWGNDTVQALKQKSLGQAIMVSDFIDEVDGYLRVDSEEARVYLEHQSEGYWKNEHMIQQVNKCMNIFEKKYTDKIALFIFDNAPSHMKKPAPVIGLLSIVFNTTTINSYDMLSTASVSL